MPERQSTDDNNPFAPPPEGRPDQPWQPRRPEGREGSDDDGSGDPDAPGPSDPPGPSDGRWSPRQPGPSQDGFGRGPERQGGQGGPGQGGRGGPGQGGSGRGPGLRWDPTDPAQRRARYAILSGVWGFFCALFELPELALLLGALGLYWAISSLRAKPREGGEAGAGTGAGAGAGAGEVSPTSQAASQPSGRGAPPKQEPSAAAAPLRSMRTAAITGLVTSSLALAIVAAGFTLQVVYRDFYECRDDALTHAGELACNDLLPKPLRAGFGVRE